MSHTPHLIIYTQPTALQIDLIILLGKNGPADTIAGHVLHLLSLHRTSILNKYSVLGSSKWEKKKKKIHKKLKIIKIIHKTLRIIKIIHKLKSIE